MLAQSFSQYLAGVLVATGLHQCLYQLLLMFAQNYVAGRHVFGSEGSSIGPLDQHWQITPIAWWATCLDFVDRSPH